eukprot:GILK01003992.1.p1 GENE.GILK01003992.1~~GILK01003992.1.p1  ORF type:complete len:1230 (+),score=358.28 GILK01003992.1:523-3690(+)
MKPPETLSMIEEASGTKMYEMKKKSAVSLISKKQGKFDEINKVIVEDMTPRLEQLRKEKSGYMQWTANNTEIERSKRFCIAVDYHSAQSSLQNRNSQLQEMEKEQSGFQQRMSAIDTQTSKLIKEEGQLRKQREDEMEGEFKALEDTVTALSKELVAVEAVHRNKHETLTAERRSRKQQELAVQDLLTSIKEKQALLNKATESAARVASEVAAMEQKQADVQRQLQAVLAGVSVEDSENNQSLQEMLNDAETKKSHFSSAARQCQLRIKHLEVELKEKRKLLKAQEKDFGHLKKEEEEAKVLLSKLESALAATQFSEERQQHLITEKRREQQIISDLKDRSDTLSAQLSSVDFQFKDPERSFDRSRVKGLVANLVHVNEREVAGAMEIAAGGKLYNVVVDTEQTGKLLLTKGQLRKRVTIIPLNKIDSKVVSDKTLRSARQVAGDGRVDLALSLVGYEEDVDAAMRYVFGGTLIVDSAETAKRVTFHPSVRTRSVTHQGDLFDPSGTLTGGATPAAGSVLLKLQQLRDVQAELQQHQSALEAIEVELAALSKRSTQYFGLKQELELKTHQCQLLKERASQSSYQLLASAVDAIQTQIEEAKTSMEQHAQAETDATREAERLQTQIREFKGKREQQVQELEQSLERIRKEVAGSVKRSKKQQQEVDQFTIELEGSQEELNAQTRQNEQNDSLLSQLEKEVEAAAKRLADKQEEYGRANKDLESRRKVLMATDKTLSSLSKQREALARDAENIELELKRLEHKIQRFHKDQRDAATYVEKMQQNHPWISTEKQFFGKPHTDYDFSARNPEEVRSRLDSLVEEQARLSKRINKKVMSMFEKAEQEYQELVNKRDIIETDKKKIETVIRELDEKKNQALKKTWERVNKDFGSIFSTLLPGTNAKLEPPEGMTVHEGLEIKVAFHGVWKSSLTELSGGQRSLLALSLVLALLLFKPAPMYILDEIDAALDLSHTQNMGQMLRTHFPQSQFLVVSLKEGMFSNANVLFRTKFVDGVSTVARHVLRQKVQAAGASAKHHVAAKSSKASKAASEQDKENSMIQ